MSFLFGKYVDSTWRTVSSCGTSFNSDISNWNTSSVTNMKYVIPLLASRLLPLCAHHPNSLIHIPGGALMVTIAIRTCMMATTTVTS